MIERCKLCGANLAMVGIRHRCIQRELTEDRLLALASEVSKKGRLYLKPTVAIVQIGRASCRERV